MQLYQSSLFDTIVDDLHQRGYSIQRKALPDDLSHQLYKKLISEHCGELREAGVGRDAQHVIDKQVRGDRIKWIDDDDAVGKAWLDWTSELQSAINRQLFMGLDYFESHFAHYPPGAFYQRHVDSFKGQSNRVLSTVTYLNPDWSDAAGGELVLYKNEHDTQGIKVAPHMGTLVVFLSEEFPHEVLPATCERYSIAGWFRQKSPQGKVF